MHIKCGFDQRVSHQVLVWSLWLELRLTLGPIHMALYRLYWQFLSDHSFSIATLFSLRDFKSQIKTSINRSGFSALTHALFGPPKLIKELYAERDLIFCIAACMYIFCNQNTAINLTNASYRVNVTYVCDESKTSVE